MRSAAALVRRERAGIPKRLVLRSRTIVRIRNGSIALAVGLCLWLPMAIATYSPDRFLHAMPAFLGLTMVLAGVAWFVLCRTEQHAVDVLDMIAEVHPDRVKDLAGLMSMPRPMLVFGPWYPAVFLPRFAQRWVSWVRDAFRIPG